MKTLSLPTKGFGHCLAFPDINITEEVLVKMLRYCRDTCGLHGLVVVAVLVDRSLTPARMASIFKRERMHGVICGFLSGTGLDPFAGGTEAALASIEQQAQFVLALVKAKVGDPIMIGPTHTHHMTQRPDWDAQGMNMVFLSWMKRLDRLAKKLGIRFLCEALNKVEDGTKDPFNTIAWTIRTGRLTRLGLHLDIGHWTMRKMTPEQFVELAPLVGFFEWANLGRNPLGRDLGIDMKVFAQGMAMLPKDCKMGLEPFHAKVIEAFKLEKLCDTTTDGEMALSMDAAFLRALRVLLTTKKRHR